MKKQTEPHNIWFQTLQRACKRGPHSPTPMRSGQSHGPIKMWVCDKCYIIEHTVNMTPPICAGGSRQILQGKE